MKSHLVVNLLEADFGCEGRPEGMKAQTEVVLRDIDGSVMNVTVDDEELIKEDINEGDWVMFTRTGEIIKE